MFKRGGTEGEDIFGFGELFEPMLEILAQDSGSAAAFAGDDEEVAFSGFYFFVHKIGEGGEGFGLG